MAAAVAWSYDTLSAGERDLFEALCLLEGSFDLDGVRAVAGDRAALPVLLSLVDKSLVVVLGGSPRRYRILETLREYAAQRRSPERTLQVQQQIIAWVSSVAEQADTELFGPRSREWMERLDQDKDTIRAALAWSTDDPSTRLRIAVGMLWFWYRRGHIVEGLRALAPLVRRRSGKPGPAQLGAVAGRDRRGAAVLSGGGLPADPRRARARPAAGRGNRRRRGTDLRVGRDRLLRGGQRRHRQAMAHASEALAIARQIGSDQFIAFSHLTMAMAQLRSGAVAEAERSAAAGLRHADACGFAWGAVACAWIMSKARIAAGDFSEPTVAALARVVNESALNRDVTSWLVGLVSEAYVFLQRGDGERAAELVGIASSQGRRIGFAPEAMDPVETRRFLDEIMQAVHQRGLSVCYDRGRDLDTQAAFERAAELVSTVPR